MKNIFFQKGSIGLVMLVIVLSVVILGGAIGGALYYTKIKNENLSRTRDPARAGKSQNDNAKSKIEETESAPTASVIPSETEESLAGLTNETADWQIYNGKYYSSKYNFKYPKNYRISNFTQESFSVARLDDDILSEIFRISFSACSIPNNFEQVENNIAINEYNYNGYLKLPNNNGCLAIDSMAGLEIEDNTIFDQILSTFKFTE